MGVNTASTAKVINLPKDDVFMFATSSNCYYHDTYLTTPEGKIQITKIKRGMLIKTKNGFKKVVRLLE
jgi:hypothetical protein